MPLSTRSLPNSTLNLTRPGAGPGLKPLAYVEFGRRHAARILSRAADRGAHVATGAPLGFGTRPLAAQVSVKLLARTTDA